MMMRECSGGKKKRDLILASHSDRPKIAKSTATGEQQRVALYMPPRVIIVSFGRGGDVLSLSLAVAR